MGSALVMSFQFYVGAQSFERTGRDNQWELLKLVLDDAEAAVFESEASQSLADRAKTLELKTVRFELLKTLIQNTKIWMADPAEVRANQNLNTLRLVQGLFRLMDGATCLVLNEAWQHINFVPSKPEDPRSAFSRLMPHYKALEDCLIIEGVQEAKRSLLSYLEIKSKSEEKFDFEIRSARLEYDILGQFNETKRGRFDFPLPSLEIVAESSGLRIDDSFFKRFTNQEKLSFTQEIRIQFEHVLASHLRSIFLLITEIGLNYSGDREVPELFPNLERSVALLSLLQNYYERIIRRGGFDRAVEGDLSELIRSDLKFLLDRSNSIFH
jgi:hypothetical protein